MPKPELRPAERDRVLSTFVGEYNRLHGTAYRFKRDGPPEDPSCDYLCVDPDRLTDPLKIQHTRAWAHVDTERKDPKRAEEFVTRYILPQLRERRVAGYSIHITVGDLPPDREGQDLIGNVVWSAVEHAIDGPLPPPSYRSVLNFDGDDSAEYYDRIRPFVRRLAVYRVEGSQEPAIISWGTSPIEEGFAGAEQRAVWALDAKDERLGRSAADLVLLIHYDVMPYDDQIDLPEIQRVLRDRKVSFREVWVVSDWLNPFPMAHRVWPGSPQD